MKVIDLLNKIANDEEVPKKVLYNKNEYSYVERNRMFAKYIKEPFNARLPHYLFTDIVNIEDEVEIIEPKEHKIPEKIIIGKKQPVHRIKKIEKKINEIIDYLEVNND